MSLADLPIESPAIQLLQRSLQQGRLGHAYLFIGPNLLQLEEIARNLAKILHCQNAAHHSNSKPRSTSCDHCSACRRIDQAQHPDVTWIRPESKTQILRVKQIREVIHVLNHKPNEGDWKTAVLVGADRMNAEAANAFLKTLEEPPASSTIILLSDRPERLLPTILSRCLRLTFGNAGNFITLDGEESWLTAFAQDAVEPGFGILARYKLLDRLLTRLAQIHAQVEQEKTAESPLQQYQDLEPALAKQWEDELKAAIEGEYRSRRASAIAALHWWLRDIWLITLAGTEELLAFPQLKSHTLEVARRLAAPVAEENLHQVERLLQQMDSNVQEALALEVGLLKLTL